MQSNYAGSRNAHSTAGTVASGSYSAASSTSIDHNNESDSDPSAPASNHRDSIGSIIDDPFFQTYDPAIQAATASDDDDQSDGSSIYQSLDEDHEHLFHDTQGNNFGNPAKPRKRRSGAEGKKPNPESDDNDPNRYWPPPRRESLTATPSSYWVCNISHHMRTHSSYRGAMLLNIEPNFGVSKAVMRQTADHSFALYSHKHLQIWKVSTLPSSVPPVLANHLSSSGSLACLDHQSPMLPVFACWLTITRTL